MRNACRELADGRQAGFANKLIFDSCKLRFHLLTLVALLLEELLLSQPSSLFRQAFVGVGLLAVSHFLLQPAVGVRQFGTCRVGSSPAGVKRFAQRGDNNPHGDKESKPDLVLQVGSQKRKMGFDEEDVGQNHAGNQCDQRGTESTPPSREHDCRVICRKRRGILQNGIKRLAGQRCYDERNNRRAIVRKNGLPTFPKQSVHG